jgi:hypothetical protein
LLLSSGKGRGIVQACVATEHSSLEYGHTATRLCWVIGMDLRTNDKGVCLCSRSEAFPGLAVTEDEVRTFMAVGADLWTEREGASLAHLKHRRQRLREIIESDAHSHSSYRNLRALRLLAALGPAWWMVGVPEDALELIGFPEGGGFLGEAELSPSDCGWEEQYVSECAVAAGSPVKGPQTHQSWVGDMDGGTSVGHDSATFTEVTVTLEQPLSGCLGISLDGQETCHRIVVTALAKDNLGSVSGGNIQVGDMLSAVGGRNVREMAFDDVIPLTMGANIELSFERYPGTDDGGTLLLQPRPWLEGVPRRLLLACALDGAATNAYALTRYDQAGSLHAKALQLADSYLAREQNTPSEEDEARRTVGDQPGQGVIHETRGYSADARVVRARALDGLGRVLRETGLYAASLVLHDQAAAVAMEMASAGAGGNISGEGGWRQHMQSLRPSPATLAANAVSNAGVAANRNLDPNLSTQYHEEARRLRVPRGDLRGTASTLGNLALLLAAAGSAAGAAGGAEEVARALQMYRESMELRSRLHDVWGVAGSLRAIGHLLAKRSRGLLPAPGEGSDADDRGGNGEWCGEGEGERGVHARKLHQLKADTKQAKEVLASAILGLRAVGDMLGVAECCESLAVVLLPAGATITSHQGAAQEDYCMTARGGDAARLFGAAMGVRRRTGAATDMVTEYQAVRVLRGHEVTRASWQEGERAGEVASRLEEVMAMAAKATVEGET